MVACSSGGALQGFGRATVHVGDETWTVAIADTTERRTRGLMGVEDLGDLDGMLFVHDRDTGGGFWMKDTLIPLDIAFFTADGTLVDLLEMEPCRADPCPSYFPRAPYRYALEVERGGFAGIEALRLEL